MSTPFRDVALIAALCCVPSVARAHTPLAGALAVAPDDSGALALRMPGFGFLLATAAAPGAAKPRFAYACDALLGVSPIETQVPMAYRDDGTLLVGTQHGVRMLSRAGCPTASAALALPVVALALHPSARQRVYAVAAGTDRPPSVQRSDDGGESWTEAGSLPGFAVSALVLDPSDPETLYVSQTTATERSQVAVSRDGGATFDILEQDRDLTLLAVQEKPFRLWAMARVVGKNVGVTILRASQLNAPWQELLTVNFFGGFALDPDDANVIWVGDEARGVYRSSDGGDTFEKTQPSVAAACLAYGTALWACTLGLPTQTALVRSPDALQMFEPVMAFSDVDRLVDCSPEVDVAQVCAPAWVEWQRDILGQPPVIRDAGASDADASDAGASDAGASDAGSPAAAPPGKHDAGQRAGRAQTSRNSGCSTFAPRSARCARWGWLLVLAGSLARARSRRALLKRASARCA